MMKKLATVAAVGLSLTGCPQEATSCVARGTRVLTPQGWEPIETLAVGDVVFAFDEETGERFETEIAHIRTAKREVGSVTLGEETLRMTSDHPVYCPFDKKYVPAGDWFLGDRATLLYLEGDRLVERAVDAVETFVEVTDVFDISVAHELHNFVAERVLVHNKKYGDNSRLADTAVEDATVDMTDDVGDTGADPDTGTSSDASSDMETDATPDMADPRHRGFCEIGGDDCPDGSTCITIPENEPDGYHVCQADAVAEPGCDQIVAPDECCVHQDCTTGPAGRCIRGPIFYCGGIAPVPSNVCLYDECQSDDDCGYGMCLPARVLGEPVRRCVETECAVDADCTLGDAGECRAFNEPCNGRLRGFFCTYESSECRTDEDCEPDPDNVGTPYCAPTGTEGETECRFYSPPP